MASFSTRLRHINSQFGDTLLAHPRRASRRFDRDLASLIRDQVRAGMGNTQTNRQSSSGDATNQNRVTGGGSSDNRASLHDDMAASGVTQAQVRTEALKRAQKHLREGRKLEALAAMDVARDSESFYSRGGKGPVPGKPYVDGGPRGHFYDEPNAHGPLRLQGNLIGRYAPNPGEYSLAGLLRRPGRKRSHPVPY